MEYNLENKSMRRGNKEITDKLELEDIINKSQVCRLAVCKNNIPYIIPISFGYDGLNLYVHTAIEGRKIEFWETNPLVCFEFDIDVKVIKSENACKWTSAYRSIIGYGKISEILEERKKNDALNHIMMHYSGKNWEFEPKDLKAVRLWKIEIAKLQGKKSNIE
jgi:nitroimidazol reductase NimA-like FMN-containing flavoprotein (pyridoxamine 5'-phosphate oxidase superfamily)